MPTNIGFASTFQQCSFFRGAAQNITTKFGITRGYGSPFFPISTNERIVLVSHSHHVALLGHGWWLGDRR